MSVAQDALAIIDRRLGILALWPFQDALHIALSEMHCFNLLQILLLRLLEIGDFFLDARLACVVCTRLSLLLEEL